MTHPTIGTVAMGDTEAMIEAAAKALADRNHSLHPEAFRGIAKCVLDAALSTRPAQEPVAIGEPEGWELVPKSAIMWLIGAGPDANGDWFEKPEGAPSFWWRTHFNKLRADAVAARSELAAPQPVLSQPEVKAETGVRYEWDGIAGKMRYFGSSAPNGWQGDQIPSLAPNGEGKLHQWSGEGICQDCGCHTSERVDPCPVAWRYRHVPYVAWSYSDKRHPSPVLEQEPLFLDPSPAPPALCPLSDIPEQAGEVRGPTLAETDAANAEAGAAAISAILDTTASEGE